MVITVAHTHTCTHKWQWKVWKTLKFNLQTSCIRNNLEMLSGKFGVVQFNWWFELIGIWRGCIFSMNCSATYTVHCMHVSCTNLHTVKFKENTCDLDHLLLKAMLYSDAAKLKLNSFAPALFSYLTEECVKIWVLDSYSYRHWDWSNHFELLGSWSLINRPRWRMVMWSHLVTLWSGALSWSLFF